MKKYSIFLAPFFLFVALTTAKAQFGGSYGGAGSSTWNNPISASMSVMIQGVINRKMLERSIANRQGKRVSSTTTSNGSTSVPERTRDKARSPNSATTEPEVSMKTPEQIDAAVRFRSTGTQLKTQAIADELSAGDTPEAKKKMFTILSTFLSEYEKAARAQGKPNDLALAITAALVYNSSIYNGTPEPEDARIMEIRDALAELVVEGDSFASMNDRQKQELYETAVIFTMLAKAGYDEAKTNGDTSSMAIYRNLAGQTLQAVSGLPPEKINLGVQPAAEEPVPYSPPASPPSSPQNIPATTIHAGLLVIEFEGNEVRANQMYGGKRIRVNGTVNSIDIQKNGQIILTFHSPAGGYAQTQCYFNKSQSSRLAELSGGQEAIVEGTVKGIGGGLNGRGFVVLENCTVP